MQIAAWIEPYLAADRLAVVLAAAALIVMAAIGAGRIGQNTTGSV